MKELDDFYLRLEEPNRATLLALRDIILAQDENISVAWKYSLPFFCYKGKMFATSGSTRKQNIRISALWRGNTSTILNSLQETGPG